MIINYKTDFDNKHFVYKAYKGIIILYMELNFEKKIDFIWFSL